MELRFRNGERRKSRIKGQVVKKVTDYCPYVSDESVVMERTRKIITVVVAMAIAALLIIPLLSA